MYLQSEKGEVCAHDITKLPVARCKMIFTKTLRTTCCLLMHPEHNHTQCICAGRVLQAPYLIHHESTRLHLGCASLCELAALKYAFTYELQNIVANMP